MLVRVIKDGGIAYIVSSRYKYRYPSNMSCNKSCDIGKIMCMVIISIPLGCVNNNVENSCIRGLSIKYVDFPYNSELFYDN